MRQYMYPFTAIVGQEKMKTALILNLVDPTIGGVLIRGEKGTAKSTAVRGLALLLPEVEVVAGCPFGCDPTAGEYLCTACAERVANGETLETERRRVRVVDLPVGSTEDRVVGTLDLEWAIKKGERRFEPGILAEANRSILYVDEVNLLDDHIVDVLLDAAAMGVNTVERESVSFSHPAGFMLVGTMNPEEGELRPQLLDRFGLCVEVRGIMDIDARVELVRRRAAFEADPAGFLAARENEERELGRRIVTARERVAQVQVSDDVLRAVAEIAIGMNVDGHRADLVMVRAARALAALEGCDAVTRDHVREASEMALPHRMRKKPFQKIGLDSDRVETILAS